MIIHLSPHSTAEEMCDMLRINLVRVASSTIQNLEDGRYAYSVRPSRTAITGLFMMGSSSTTMSEEPMCIRTDISHKMDWKDIISNKLGSPHTSIDYLPTTISDAIHRWYEEGYTNDVYGKALIYMYNYSEAPMNYGKGRHNNKRASCESYPYNIGEGKYFYHLGRYGNGHLWNIVAEARRNQSSVPKAIYDRYKETQEIYKGRIEQYPKSLENNPDLNAPMHWTEMFNGDHYYNGETREYNTFIWNRGHIEHIHKTTQAQEIIDGQENI